MASLSSLAPLRGLRVQLPHARCIPLNVRGIHASVPSLKKKSASTSTDAFAEEDVEEDEEDLFASSPSTSSSASSDSDSGSASNYKLDRANIRQTNLDRILNHAKLTPHERRRDKIPLQALRQVVACTEIEQIDDFKKVLRAAKLGEVKITKRTAAEIVGRCVNLGKPELAAELIANRAQYALPLMDQPTLIKLHHALASHPSQTVPKLPYSQPISSTLSLLRLNILQQSGSAASDKDVLSLQRISSEVKGFKDSKVLAAWRDQAKEKLIGAGGIWAEAVKKVEAKV